MFDAASCKCCVSLFPWRRRCRQWLCAALSQTAVGYVNPIPHRSRGGGGEVRYRGRGRGGMATHTVSTDWGDETEGEGCSISPSLPPLHPLPLVLSFSLYHLVVVSPNLPSVLPEPGLHNIQFSVRKTQMLAEQSGVKCREGMFSHTLKHGWVTLTLSGVTLSLLCQLALRGESQN